MANDGFDPINIEFEFIGDAGKSRKGGRESEWKSDWMVDQSLGSLDKMNQLRPDDRTLEDLFQKTIVSGQFFLMKTNCSPSAHDGPTTG